MSIEPGAAASAFLAILPLFAGVCGRYFEDGVETGTSQTGVRSGIVEHALAPEKAVRLWPASVEMLVKPKIVLTAQ
jgi:hypothetical protein